MDKKINMKPSLKLGLGLVVVATVSFSYLHLNRQDDLAPTPNVPSIHIVGELLGERAEKPQNASSTQASIEADVQSVIAEAEEKYLNIIKLSGTPNLGKMSYEDDWCVGYEDLSESEYAYAETQMNEWKLSRGYASHNVLAKYLDDDNVDEGLNTEYLINYEDADDETLLRLAQQDDMLALTTILNYQNTFRFDNETRLNAAKQLITLGGTSKGVRTLVLDNLVNVDRELKKRKDTGEGNPLEYLKTALVYAEFSLMRKDATSFEHLLRHISKSGALKELGTELLTANDFKEISQRARSVYDEANQTRLDKGLDSFDQIDEPKVMDIYYDETLARVYREYGDMLGESFFPLSWKKEYLRQTPCSTRLLAKDAFYHEKLPIIEQKIAQLRKGS